ELAREYRALKDRANESAQQLLGDNLDKFKIHGQDLERAHGVVELAFKDATGESHEMEAKIYLGDNGYRLVMDFGKDEPSEAKQKMIEILTEAGFPITETKDF
ncbi:MAG: hypothetical protein ABH846_03255, partial [Patescibacteria group bacterium]